MLLDEAQPMSDCLARIARLELLAVDNIRPAIRTMQAV